MPPDDANAGLALALLLVAAGMVSAAAYLYTTHPGYRDMLDQVTNPTPDTPPTSNIHVRLYDETNRTRLEHTHGPPIPYRKLSLVNNETHLDLCTTRDPPCQPPDPGARFAAGDTLWATCPPAPDRLTILLHHHDDRTTTRLDAAYLRCQRTPP